MQQVDEDESYHLQITATEVHLEAANPLGVLHGLQTFLQLVRITPRGFVVPAMTIDDQPRFPWRGLMLDVGRHFQPLDVVYRTLDGMEAVKLNVFHWHLSEDQGFRVESKKFPLLQEKGSDGLFYTQEEIRDVIEYARDRGHSRGAGVRHAWACHGLVRWLSGPGQRFRPVSNRAQVGRVRPRDGSHA